MNGLAVCKLAVANATVGFQAAVLRTQEGTTLLLLGLEVLEDGHWKKLHSVQVPVAWPGSICSPGGPNAYPYTTKELVAVDTKCIPGILKKGPKPQS